MESGAVGCSLLLIVFPSLEGFSLHSRDIVDDRVPRYYRQFSSRGKRMPSKMFIFGMDTFDSPTQIRSNGHCQSPSTKKVQLNLCVPFEVVGLTLVIQSNLIHFLVVQAVARPIWFGCCVCFGCVFSCLQRSNFGRDDRNSV
jgi:hypothetical protein